MWKKHKIVVLPTEWSKILIATDGREVNKVQYYDGDYQGKSNSQQPHHLFILSDEEIKEGDCIIYLNQIINNVTRLEVSTSKYFTEAKKIIASTDKSLNLPSPTDEFLEEWVELSNSSPVDEIEVEYIPNLQLEGQYQTLITPKSNINCRFIQTEDSWDDIHIKANIINNINDIDAIWKWLKENYDPPKTKNKEE